MGLYLDQTVQFINGYFRDFPGVELTPSMVSNYVKKGIISHPVKKKYTREQLASLMYIAVSKTVLSMENIDALFQMQRAHCTAEEAYNYFCDEMENCLPFVFGAHNTIRDLAVDAATEGIANDSETGAPFVIYRKLYGDGGLWLRPLEMFLSKVEKEKYPDCPQEYRFELQEIPSKAGH